MIKQCLLMIFFLLIGLTFPVSAQSMPVDGDYTVEVTLSGGSGRSTIASPAALSVVGGAGTVTVKWSSSNYTYMKIDGVYYYPVSTEDGSCFEIPAVLDEDMAVTAQTTAMSEPHDIDYTLYIDSGSVKSTDQGNSGSSERFMVIVAAGISIVLLMGMIKVKKRQMRHEI